MEPVNEPKTRGQMLNEALAEAGKILALAEKNGDALSQKRPMLSANFRTYGGLITALKAVLGRTNGSSEIFSYFDDYRLMGNAGLGLYKAACYKQNADGSPTVASRAGNNIFLCTPFFEEQFKAHILIHEFAHLLGEHEECAAEEAAQTCIVMAGRFPLATRYLGGCGSLRKLLHDEFVSKGNYLKDYSPMQNDYGAGRIVKIKRAALLNARGFQPISLEHGAFTCIAQVTGSRKLTPDSAFTISRISYLASFFGGQGSMSTIISLKNAAGNVIGIECPVTADIPLSSGQFRELIGGD